MNNNRRRNFRSRPQKNNFRRRSGSLSTGASNSLSNNGNINFNRKDDVKKFIETIKITLEDYWKSQNEINTSVKLPLTISVKNSNNLKINQLEEKLSNIDLIYNFYIYKFNNKNNIYKIIFNGTPSKFLEVMNDNNYKFETTNKIWVMK